MKSFGVSTRAPAARRRDNAHIINVCLHNPSTCL